MTYVRIIFVNIDWITVE